MGTYTFICEHAGGTYISQFIANDMMTAFSQWISYFCCSQYACRPSYECGWLRYVAGT